MHLDDCLSLLQSLLQAGILPLEACDFFLQRIWFHRLGARLLGLQPLVHGLLPLLPPMRQCPGVNAFTAAKSTQLTMFALVSFGKDPQLVLTRERPRFGRSGYLRVGDILLATPLERTNISGQIQLPLLTICSQCQFTFPRPYAISFREGQVSHLC